MDYSQPSFLYQQYLRQYREHMFSEILSILILLYGSHIQEGDKTIKDYLHYTAVEIERELAARTILTEGKIYWKRKRREEKEIKDNKEAIKSLMKIANNLTQ